MRIQVPNIYDPYTDFSAKLTLCFALLILFFSLYTEREQTLSKVCRGIGEDRMSARGFDARG